MARSNENLCFSWVTDLHFELASEQNIDKFYTQLSKENPTALIISGDIGENGLFLEHLEQMQETINAPVYFVLGNHDFYGCWIASTHEKVAQLLLNNDKLHYLTTGEIVPINKQWALVGHDGWADGGYGNFIESKVELRDFHCIEDLRYLTPKERLEKVQGLGRIAADELKRTVEAAFCKFDCVLINTHTPPFIENAFDQAKDRDSDWTPHLTCYSIGQMLMELMQQNPNKKVTVLCGHSHEGTYYSPLENLEVISGKVNDNLPQIQKSVSLCFHP